MGFFHIILWPRQSSGDWAAQFSITDNNCPSLTISSFSPDPLTALNTCIDKAKKKLRRKIKYSERVVSILENTINDLE